ncbi:hypothetical protein U9M48_029400 [Paspalum notatum var. saurae]|uniref:No apical meristem-associated C-terminal domain-containing protein n=1 Tax=Paspalum notatum var. saurae TaxID=547442 RepID=A0AAQ3TYU5_PASNO
MPQQFVEESMAADEGDMGTFLAGEGYFSNLLNEENPNMLFDDFSGPPEDHSSPVAVSTPSLRPNQKRSKNFNENEDSLIVSVWLNISTDPVYGINQTRGAFWKRVHDFFHKHKNFESGRTQIEDRRQSGVTFQDKLVQALALFRSEDSDNKSFQFMHCWNELRNQPKWHDKRRQIDAIKQASNKKSKVKKNSSPETATTIIPDSSRIDILKNASPEKDAPKRPIGKKKDKEALRRGMLIKRLQNIFGEKKEFDAEKEKKKEKRFNQAYELEKERLRLDEKNAAMEEKI